MHWEQDFKSGDVWTAAAPPQLLTGLRGCPAVPNDHAHGLSKGLHRALLEGAINDAEGVDVWVAADPTMQQSTCVDAMRSGRL